MELRGIEQGAVKAGGDQRPCGPCRGEAATAATTAASQPDRALRQNATLALAALPNGRTSSGSAPISRIACTLFSRPSTQRPRRPRSRAAARCWRGGRRDQDHQREDDRTGRDQFGAQNARMHRDAAGEREGKRCDQRDAPVANDADGPGRRRSARSRLRSARRERARREPRWSWRRRRRRRRRPVEC